MKGKFTVYILRGKNRKRYIGITSDLIKRIEEHNAGKSIFTKKYIPWKIEWVSAELPHNNALSLERKLKRQKGGNGLRVLMDTFSRSS